MPIRYYFDERKGLVYEKLEGEIYVSDLQSVIENDLASGNFPKGVKAVFEIDNAKIHFNIAAIMPTIKLLAKHPEKLYRARWAFLCTEPLHVAYLYYFKQLSKFLPLSVEIFSTMEGCLSWLGITQEELSGLQKKIEDSAVVVK